MKIADLTPTDLTRCIVTILIVGVTCLLWFQQVPIPTALDVAFWAVLGALGIASAKPVVSDTLKKLYGKTPAAKPDGGSVTPDK